MVRSFSLRIRFQSPIRQYLQSNNRCNLIIFGFERTNNPTFGSQKSENFENFITNVKRLLDLK